MSRRRRAEIRVAIPDPIYHDKNVTTFINKLMYIATSNSEINDRKKKIL